VLRIMLPVVATGRPIRHVLPVGVVYKRVVPIDGDVVVAAPPAVVTPAAAPGRSHRNPNPKRNCHTSGVVSGWRIGDGRVRINWRAVHDRWVVTGNIYNLRAGLLDHDDLLAFNHLGFDFLLLT